jgi:hypothetical protein
MSVDLHNPWTNKRMLAKLLHMNHLVVKQSFLGHTCHCNKRPYPAHAPPVV